MSFSAAARYMKKSKDFVRKWVNRYKEVKNVDDLPERGKTRVTTKKQDKMIVQLFEKHPTYNLRQVQKILARKGVEVSLKTIERRLQSAGYGWRSTTLKPFLKPEHCTRRLEWAKENFERDWSNVVFTDESSFWAWVPTRRAWSLRGQPFIQRSVKHPVKVHVWGCFCTQGFGVLHVFSGILNAERMLQIYKKALLKSTKKWFGEENDDWILQEDNDPKHRSRLCSQWKEENGITVLQWPSQSPDANPIENVWSAMKHKLQGKRVFTIQQLTRHLREIWKSLPCTLAENLVKSMPRRCQAILDNHGDWTPY